MVTVRCIVIIQIPVKNISTSLPLGPKLLWDSTCLLFDIHYVLSYTSARVSEFKAGRSKNLTTHYRSGVDIYYTGWDIIPTSESAFQARCLGKRQLNKR
jgi:hypothetical protein